MWISCWNCGEEVWLETQKLCRHCDAPSRRCVDCRNFDPQTYNCADLNIEVAKEEAHRPGRLSLSMTCDSYDITDKAAARKGAVKTKSQAPQPAAAPAAPAAPASPSSQAVTAPPASSNEYITIRREPPIKRPSRPIVIAHRGASAAAPENTLKAFTIAIQNGAQAIELDLHITSDGHPVVIHDANLDRTTSATGPVAAQTLAALKALDAGSWFNEEFKGEQIPTLDEVFDAIQPPTPLFLHLRAHENPSDRWERAVVDTITRHDARKRSVITSHTRHALHRIRALDEKLRLCWIPVGAPPGDEYIDDTCLLGARFLQPRLGDIDEGFVNYAHEKHLWINAFWADTEEEMQQAIALGVDGIITNHPGRLKELLHR